MINLRMTDKREDIRKWTGLSGENHDTAKYGAKYDSWSCGNCGHGLKEPYWKFCPICGYRVGKRIHCNEGDK